MNEPSPAELDAALRRGAAAYFAGCRGRIDDFITRHFRYPGAWQTNRPAFGWDLLRAPANLFWAPFHVLAMLLSWLAGSFGWARASALLGRVPAGFSTRVQRHIADLVYRDLLQRDVGAGESDPLCAAMAASIGSLCPTGMSQQRLAAELEPVLAQALARYSVTRTASADITNSLASTVLGAFAFKKFTPGGIAIGFLLASWWAQRSAVESFPLGEFLGSVYYRWFPAEPSTALQVTSVGIVLLVLAAFASFSGLLTDPIQSWTGLHRHRLNKMIDTLQRDFEAGRGNTFNPRDPYLARMLEVLDIASRW